MADSTSGLASITDHRTPPHGVLPRRLQLWLMIGLAVTILAIIAFGGQKAPVTNTVTPVAGASAVTDPSRLQDFQDRLRLLDERARQRGPSDPPRPAVGQPTFAQATATTTEDPLQAERRRRLYESLFASNLVMSRRPDAERFTTNRGASAPGAVTRGSDAGLPTAPSLQDVADAVVRATSRYSPSTEMDRVPTPAQAGQANSIATTSATANGLPPRPISTGPISSAGPIHRLLEGTVIDTVLTNRLDGGVAAPVNCLVTSPVYSHDGTYVLIPAGSRVLGETKPVQALGDTRLAVAFNRLVLPDGSTYRLDQFMGLNDIGDAGLRDQVNQHYRSTFGASAAVGLITGLAQSIGTLGLNRGDGNRTVIVAGNVGDATSQATAQTMNRFLNRAPTVTIREGHRIKVYLTSDLDLPAYDARIGANRPQFAAVQ
jgi:type IV secretion system protein TrbI